MELRTIIGEAFDGSLAGHQLGLQIPHGDLRVQDNMRLFSELRDGRLPGSLHY